MEKRAQEKRKRWYIRLVRKTLAISRNEWQRMFTYRFSIICFRASHLIEVLVQIIIWTVIFKGNEIIQGYTHEEMITYIIIGFILSFVTENYSFEAVVRKHIHEGTLSNILVKPIGFIRYISSVSFGKSVITIFSFMVSVPFLFFFFHDLILLPAGLFELLIAIFMVVIGYFINLFFSILIGFVAFWFIQTSGFFSSASVIIRFFSGRFFPIDLLPKVFVNVSLLLPFVYLRFAPTQLYLGRMSIADGLRGLGIEILWLFILYGIVKLVWRRGLKKYEGVGI